MRKYSAPLPVKVRDSTDRLVDGAGWNCAGTTRTRVHRYLRIYTQGLGGASVAVGGSFRDRVRARQAGGFPAGAWCYASQFE
jgi:hypothetical protein